MQFWMKQFLRTSSENFPNSRRSNYEVYIPCYNCIGFLGLAKGAKILRILQSRCRRWGQFSLGTSFTKFKGTASTFIQEIKEDSRGRHLLKMHLILSFHLCKDVKVKEAIDVKLKICDCFYGVAVHLGLREKCKRKYRIAHAHVWEFTRYGQNSDWSSLYVLTDTLPGGWCLSAS